jgi:hypothetical protein
MISLLDNSYKIGVNFSNLYDFKNFFTFDILSNFLLLFSPKSILSPCIFYSLILNLNPKSSLSSSEYPESDSSSCAYNGDALNIGLAFPVLNDDVLGIPPFSIPGGGPEDHIYAIPWFFGYGF